MEGWQLAMVFLDDSPSFARGWECGQLDARMKSAEEIGDITVMSENVEQIRMLANLRNYSLEARESEVEGWTYLRVAKGGGPEEKRAGLSVIDGALS